MKPKLSIIIPCLNEERRLEPTLRALSDQSASPSDYEIIVVDGGSSDRTLEIARAARARVVESERGLGRQRNAGAHAAAGRWVAFVDADITVSRDWVARVIRHINRADSDMLLGPVLAPDDGTWIERAWGAHQEMRRRLASRATANIFRLATTQNLMVERSTFERAGGFDEDLSSGEDVYLTYRLWEQGARIAYDDRLAVCHRGEPKNLRDFFTQQVWHSNREVWRRMSEGDTNHAGRAYWYGAINAACMAAVAFSLVIGIISGVLMLPAAITLAYLLIPVALAGRTAWVTRSLQVTPSLALLYWVYGVARASYILGLTSLTHKQKRF